MLCVNDLRSKFGSVASHAPPSPSAPNVSRSRLPKIFLIRILVMRIERAGHNEAREALVLSVAGVTAIMLTAYLLLLILY
jgi:hypothetical protein